jgi:hypothetical protein
VKEKIFTPDFWRYLFDSCSLIDIERNVGVRALERRKGRILISKRIAYEVAYDPRIRKTDPLRQFVLRNPEMITEFQDNEEGEFLQILQQPGIGRGEASVMAIALKRGFPLVIEDRKGRGKANNHGIKTLSWQEFLRGDQCHV